MRHILICAATIGVGLGAVGAFAVVAEDAAPPPATLPAAADSQRAAAEEQWLKTVWSEIDSLVVQQDFKLHKTVAAAGVRGADADDLLLRRYYFKGGKRYSTEETLQRIIAHLEHQLRSRRRTADRARLKYLTAICADMLGQYDEARKYYAEVVKENADTPFAARARQRLRHLPASPPAKGSRQEGRE